MDTGNKIFNFYGEYTCKIDAKSRVRLPGELIEQLDAVEAKHFIINRGQDGQLILYPKDVWDQKIRKIQELNTFDAKSRDFIRLFMRGASPAKLDAGQRLLINKRLMEFAGMEPKGEICVLALFDSIELWDVKKYEDKVINRSQDEYQELAQEVMVEKPPENNDSKE